MSSPVSQRPILDNCFRKNTILPHEEKKDQHPALALAFTSSDNTSLIPGDLSALKAADELQKSRLFGLKPWMVDFVNSLPILPVDPLSNAEPEKVSTTHLVWNVVPDFKKKALNATAIYTYNNKVEGNEELKLDVLNLIIEKVAIDGKEASYKIEESKFDNKPHALVIAIPPKKGFGSVSIEYMTKPSSSSVFWIDKEYTEGKEQPLLYTLFQPNEGASAIPGQHTPQVRLTYEVNVLTGNPELMALSSVTNNPTKRNENGDYKGMRMDKAVPLYLLSLHVGNFSYRPYDKQTGVYAEDVMVDKTAKAFEELPQFLKAAEEIFGPYTWGTYRPIVLGWAFPYQGMEHPCASTCGSVCLEQPAVLPHELAHSWTGNDITNCNWQEFFWNEGWTTFAEFLIIEKIWGPDFAGMNFLYTMKETEDSMDENREKNPDLLRLINKTPTSDFNRIPYGKGALFFFMLREAIGEKFNQFMRDYIKVFTQNTMSEKRFLSFLENWLLNEMGIKDFATFSAKHKINEWLHDLEIPSNRPIIRSNLMEGIEEQAKKAIAGKPLDIKIYSEWNITTRILFLSLLAGHTSKENLQLLDEQLKLTETDKMSLKGEWSKQCAAAGLFTDDTKKMILTYVIARNSVLETKKIAASLNKTDEGIALMRQILQEEKGRLFPLTRKVLEEKLTESKVEHK